MKTNLSEKEKAAQYDKEHKARKEYNYRRMVWRELMVGKAEAANITVSQAEVDVDIKRRLAERK